MPAVRLLPISEGLHVSLPGNATSLDCLEGLPALTSISAERIGAAELPRLSERRSLRSISSIGVDDPIRDLSPFLDFPRLRAKPIRWQVRIRSASPAPAAELSPPSVSQAWDDSNGLYLTAQPVVTEKSYLTKCKNLKLLNQFATSQASGISPSVRPRLAPGTIERKSPEGRARDAASSWTRHG